MSNLSNKFWNVLTSKIGENVGLHLSNGEQIKGTIESVDDDILVIGNPKNHHRTYIVLDAVIGLGIAANAESEDKN